MVCTRLVDCDHDNKSDHYQILEKNQSGNGNVSHSIPQVKNARIPYFKISRHVVSVFLIARAVGKTLTSKISEDCLSAMDLVVTIMALFAIAFGVFWGWYKLKDAKEGDMIDIGFGTHVEYWAFEMRLAIGLLVCFLVLLVGLLS